MRNFVLDLTLIATGVALFGIALERLWRTYRVFSTTRLRRSWVILALLIVFFALGYLAVIVRLIRGGSLEQLESLVALIFFAGGIFVLICANLFLGTLRERRRVEEDLREAYEALEQSSRLESIGLLAGGISHDFNNFLMAIVARAGVGKRAAKDDKDVEGEFEAIGEIAAKAGELTRQLLQFGGAQTLSRRLVRATDLISGRRQLLESVLGEDVELRIDCAADACVQGDANQLERAVLNLCLNARDAMDGEGALDITVRQEDWGGEAGVAFVFEDSGPGVPEESRDRIFDPFFTLKAGGGGTGLGLATVRSIVRKHGGMVELDSEPGDGARFKIWLPTAVSAS
jgi:signal transduction histidine kinase